MELRSFAEGFVAKCAELGVDPEDLIKGAGDTAYQMGLGRPTSAGLGGYTGSALSKPAGLGGATKPLAKMPAPKPQMPAPKPQMPAAPQPPAGTQWTNRQRPWGNDQPPMPASSLAEAGYTKPAPGSPQDFAQQRQALWARRDSVARQ